MSCQQTLPAIHTYPGFFAQPGFLGGLAARMGQRRALGIGAIDAALPRGLFGRGLADGLHEIIGDARALTGFVAALLGRCGGRREMLWFTPYDRLQPTGLAQFGLDHRRLTTASLPRAADRLWAFEEALREPAALPWGSRVVVVEADDVDPAATRRLQEAALDGASLGFLVRRAGGETAALTRWRVEAAGHAAPAQHWQVTLEHGSGSGRWLVTWDAAARSFRLAA